MAFSSSMGQHMDVAGLPPPPRSAAVAFARSKISASAGGSMVLPRSFSSALARAFRPLSPGASHSTVAPALPMAFEQLGLQRFCP